MRDVADGVSCGECCDREGAHEAGRAEERHAIITYLRDVGSGAFVAAADAIERRFGTTQSNTEDKR
jgi:hypothetical protein